MTKVMEKYQAKHDKIQEGTKIYTVWSRLFQNINILKQCAVQ